jgi:hypothetical protein
MATPQPYDFLPAMPDLSGEWADAPTPQPAQDIFGYGHTGSAFNYPPEAVLDEIADAWEAGVVTRSWPSASASCVTRWTTGRRTRP